MQKFKTRLVGMGTGEAWICLRIPFDVAKVFGTKARTFVRGTINGFPFRTSIFPEGDGSFLMMVNKAMQAGAKVARGDRVAVEMEKADGPPPLRVPSDLQKALRRDSVAKKQFDDFSYSHRKAYVDWIQSAKLAPTRERRIQKTVAMPLKGKKR